MTGAALDVLRDALHPSRVVCRHGLQGALLIACGWIWILYALAVLLDIAAGITGGPHLFLGTALRASLWSGAGLLAIVSAFRAQHRGKAAGALMVAPMIRVGSYLWSWIGSWHWVGDILPGDLSGDTRAWYFAVAHLPLVLLVVTIRYLPRGIGKDR